MVRHISDLNIEGPPTIWVISTVVGGIVTGVGLILGLEYLIDRLSDDVSDMSGTVMAGEFTIRETDISSELFSSIKQGPNWTADFLCVPQGYSCLSSS